MDLIAVSLFIQPNSLFDSLNLQYDLIDNRTQADRRKSMYYLNRWISVQLNKVQFQVIFRLTGAL